jgi:hypothetical protein
MRLMNWLLALLGVSDDMPAPRWEDGSPRPRRIVLPRSLLVDDARHIRSPETRPPFWQRLWP